MFDWDKIKEAMYSGVVEVTFTKADKSIRVMECTLAEYLLPATSGSRTSNDEVLVVFDIEKEAWRSFRKDSVISVEVPE